MDHLSPHEQELVHHYYHEIGQKGGRHRGAFNEEFGYDQNVKRGYLSSAPQDEQKAVHKFLHAVQVKKNVGEREAEEELDEEYSGTINILYIISYIITNKYIYYER
jgi:hypothetical protein